MNSLADSYAALSRPDDALAMYEKALEFRRRVLPENHPDLGDSLYNLSICYQESGKSHQAMQFAREALRIWQATLPPEHEHVLNARLLLDHLETVVK
jgi:tetratricopeptide (TPR) repeat protein